VGRGLAGRRRTFSDDHEKARQAIPRPIQRTLSEIKKDHLALWQHLKVAIKLGDRIFYGPQEDPHWQL
jgi:hypothetical protein